MDDVVLTHLEGNRSDYGDSLVSILEQSLRSRWLAPSVGVVETRKALERRLRRILDTDRPLRTRLSWAAMLLLTAFALATLPQARSAEAPRKKRPRAKPDVVKPIPEKRPTDTAPSQPDVIRVKDSLGDVVFTMERRNDGLVARDAQGRPMAQESLKKYRLPQLKPSVSSRAPRRRFPEDALRGADGEPIETKSRWVAEFRFRGATLLKSLRNRGIAFGRSTFPFQAMTKQYERRYPRSDEMPRVTRAFHIQAELVHILTDPGLALTKVDLVRVGQEGRTAAMLEGPINLPPEAEAYFLSLHLKPERMPDLIAALLCSERLKPTIYQAVAMGQQAPGKEAPATVALRVNGWLRFGFQTLAAPTTAPAIRIEDESGRLAFVARPAADGLKLEDGAGRSVDRKEFAEHPFAAKAAPPPLPPPLFPDTFTDEAGNPITTVTEWCAVFRARCSQQEKRLKQFGIAFGESSLQCQGKVRDYWKRYPTAAEQRQAAKELHMEEAFLAALTAERLSIRTIEVLRLGSPALAFAQGKGIAPWAVPSGTHSFVLAVRMDIDRVLDLVGRLQASKELKPTIQRVTPVRLKAADGLAAVQIVGWLRDSPKP